MFNNGKELLEICNSENKKIHEVVLEKEKKATGRSIEDIRKLMRENLKTMVESSNYALNKKINSVSGLIGGEANKVKKYSQNNKTLCGDIINTAMARALSTSEVNASMGKIVAAPTAGASGILPSAILTTAEKFNLDEEEIINGLFTAAGIGEIVAKNATVSGAYGGCQAECGVGAAMASAAIVEMLGGSPETCLHASSIAIINILGLVCDPIAGLVEFPCALRNASGVINALTSADLALAGIESLIPFDEVIEAMYKVGKSLPDSLKETALGGLAATPTGECLKNKVL
ncbi:L-serine ammonia-lyase, iron-sulfur-dependent, subunit alpha [Anaerosalibacter massiliensis]|uniref:L-serine dehydratase n=1 Tax=Anaerosalibacter massiliensis TaxID=1347392 RepID=A0A9X2S5Z6_9FIRM|nr:L-serine ammonia-lyase, iron-sulfur-dependent, subunit alpha [Anaerosalibacter massiliensis]MCR2043097.1 L-serine ammonia-lyase, iron-sulfur-dependent, subunit alpha [Anaerosalibacter massiliensis]